MQWMLLLLALPLLGGCGDKKDATQSQEILEVESQTWMLSCAGGQDSTWGKAAEYFGQLVSRETNGAVTVTYTFDAAQSTSAADSLRSVIDGGAELSMYAGLDWTEIDSRFGVLSLPFLFSSADAAAAALDGDGGVMLRSVLREHGMYGIGFGEDGFRFPTNSIRPVETAEDLRGLKLRVDDRAILRQAYGLWGADCVSADWPLVYTALHTRTYDGQEMPLAEADAASIQNVQTHLTQWNGFYETVFFCMDGELYDSLSLSLREMVDRCGKQTVEYQRELHRQAEQETLIRWEKKGVSVTQLTPEAAAEFRTLAQPCYDAFSTEDTQPLLAAFGADPGEN